MEKTNLLGHALPQCMQCLYYDQKTDMVSGTTANICRLNPPTSIGQIVQTPQGPQLAQATLWPVVQASDWCSKHEQRYES